MAGDDRPGEAFFRPVSAPERAGDLLESALLVTERPRGPPG